MAWSDNGCHPEEPVLAGDEESRSVDYWGWCLKRAILPYWFPAALCLLLPCAGAIAEGAADPVELTILATTDVHGHILNWDYLLQERSDVGLASVAAIVREERAFDPDLLLLDAGDTIQGTPLIRYYNVQGGAEPNPMAVVMNAMGYDAMAIGNHEYDFGQRVLERFISDAEFPVMSANIRKADGKEKYVTYVIKKVKGVNIGILGLTTVGIPAWEDPGNIRGLRFDDAVAVAREYIPRMREAGAAIIVALCHSGLHERLSERAASQNGREHGRGRRHEDMSIGAARRNFVIPLAERVPEIDVIVAGHTHVCIAGMMLNGVLVVQPLFWGKGVSKVSLVVGRDGQVLLKRGRFLASSRERVDQTIAALAAPYQEATIGYVSARIGTAARDFPGGPGARRKDGALGDFINAAQLKMAADNGHPAQISAASIFNNVGCFKKGPITVSDVYALYPYENKLTVIEISGEKLKRALEHTAGYWALQNSRGSRGSRGKAKVSRGARDYNWDMYTGVSYKIDISKPVGQRVVGLSFGGRRVRPNRRLLLAVNSYRRSGGGGYDMFKGCKILWRSSSGIREYLVDYIRTKRTINPEDYFVENWRLVP